MSRDLALFLASIWPNKPFLSENLLASKALVIKDIISTGIQTLLATMIEFVLYAYLPPFITKGKKCSSRFCSLVRVLAVD